MNEQLQGALVEILNRTISGIDASVGFMEAQLPDVIEQLLMWYAVKGVLYALVGVAWVTLFAVILRKAIRQQDGFFYEKLPYSGTLMPTVHGVIATVLSGLFGLFGLFMTTNIMTALQIWIAPKIWLMEYAAKLVN